MIWLSIYVIGVLLSLYIWIFRARAPGYIMLSIFWPIVLILSILENLR